jgi:hypothetical protein
MQIASNENETVNVQDLEVVSRLCDSSSGPMEQDGFTHLICWEGLPQVAEEQWETFRDPNSVGQGQIGSRHLDLNLCPRQRQRFNSEERKMVYRIWSRKLALL